MSNEYRLQLDELIEKVNHLEEENDRLKDEIEIARKVIESKNRLLEEQVCRVGKLHEIIRNIVDKI